jgi:hypothetical protein
MDTVTVTIEDIIMVAIIVATMDIIPDGDIAAVLLMCMAEVVVSGFHNTRISIIIGSEDTGPAKPGQVPNDSPSVFAGSTKQPAYTRMHCDACKDHINSNILHKI